VVSHGTAPTRPAGRFRPRRARRHDDAWHRRVLDAVPDPVLVAGASGEVVYANPAARALLRRPDLDGADLADLVDVAAVDAALDPGAPRAWRLPDGTSLHLEASIAPLPDGERVPVSVLTLRPIAGGADRERYEGEVQRLTASERASREIVHQLQEAVQPPQPVVPGVELGVHYLSADPTAPTGGDLYDWQVLPDGDLHVVVVDVIGKGVAATKDALAVVHALRVLVLEGLPMDRLVARADELLAGGNPGLVATVLVCRYTPGSGRLVLAGGGHPPLLRVSAGGAVDEVAAPGIPLGWPGAGSFELVETELGRSETAVLYTDGLIEARRDILGGLHDLKEAAAATAGYPARHLPRVLIERALAGASRHDDSLALVLRRRAAPAPTGRRLLGGFEHRFTPNLAAVPVARSLFGDWLRHQGVEEPTVADQLVVVSELCTNAARSASGAPGSVVLRARAEGPDLVVEVGDDGAGFRLDLPSAGGLPTPEQISGRGLFIVQAIVDDLVVEGVAGATVVRATRRSVFPEPGG
jgi:anti-sigma regulatory factor (Ser/Thr protein kinase)